MITWWATSLAQAGVGPDGGQRGRAAPASLANRLTSVPAAAHAATMATAQAPGGDVAEIVRLADLTRDADDLGEGAVSQVGPVGHVQEHRGQRGILDGDRD